MNRYKALTLLSISFASFSISTASAHNQTEIRDPLHRFNRVMFDVHTVLDGMFFEPTAWTYSQVPVGFRLPVHNALHNMREPFYFLNHLFQKNGTDALTSLKRFLINTTIGFGGIFDVAKKFGIERRKATLDESMASWGVHTGPYLFLPVLGPTNPRHLLSFAAENAGHPMAIVGYATGEHAVTYTWRGVEGLHRRAEALEPIRKVREGSLDYYASVRSVVTQKWLKRNASQMDTLYDNEFDLIEGN